MFKINKSNTKQYHPKDKEELLNIIHKLLKERGWNADLNDIDVSEVTNMSYLFDINKLGKAIGKDNATLNKIEISQWDVSNVTNMEGMFYQQEYFNCDLSEWDVSNVETCQFMFASCKSFDCDLRKWKLKFSDRSPGANAMFHQCDKFKNKNMPKFTK